MKRLISLCFLGISACGGGGSSSPPPPPPPPPPSIAGIWDLTGVANVDSIALVRGDGRVVQLADNTSTSCRSVAEGQLSVSGSSFTGSGVAVILPGCTNPDGSTSDTWVNSGTFVESSSITEQTTTTTANGTKTTVNNAWGFDPLYDEASSLSKLVGNWSDGPDTMSIDANGVMSQQDATTGCVLAGQISIIDSTKNLYAVSFTLNNCTGASAGANGVTQSGLGALDDKISPIGFLLAVSGSTSNGGVIITGGGITLNPIAATAGLKMRIR
jgi:hypothetical protein